MVLNVRNKGVTIMATLKDFNRICNLGFDESSIPARADRNGARPIHIKCFQCEASVINGVACHEQGCPNRTHECAGCNVQVPFNQRYCADCA